jgi:hypothetical protein
VSEGNHERLFWLLEVVAWEGRTFLDALNRARELVPMLVQTYYAIRGYAATRLSGMAEAVPGALPEG